MLTSVSLERFRGFNRLEATFSPVTVVMGPNSSGKTTLLYAIRFALHALTDFLNSGTSRLRSGEDKGWIGIVDGALIPDHTRYLSLANWEALFFNRRTGEGQSFKIKLGFDSEKISGVSMEVRCGRNAQLKIYISICSHELASSVERLPSKSGQINREIVDFVERHAGRAVFVPSFYGVVRAEEYRAGVVMDRLLGAGDQSHIVRNLVSRLSAEAFAQLNAFLGESLGAKLTRRTTSQDSDAIYPLGVEFRDDNGPLEISAGGAGLINLIALYSALERYRGEQRQRPLIFLLDEPEAHLHPRLQGEMASRVASLIVREFGAQVVMATHAVEIVNRLSAREDVAVLRVDRSESRAIVLKGQSAIVNELAGWADLSPFSLVNFLASRRILFYEGSSDRVILEKCAALRYRSDLVGRERFERWTLAPLSGSGNEKIAGLLERLIETNVIPSLAAGEEVRLVVVLDRDYERKSGFSDDASAGGRVRTRRLVWPVHSIESLFLRPEILMTWLSARWGNRVPPELRQWIDEAIAVADADTGINQSAVSDLLAKIVQRGMIDGERLHGDRLIKRAHERATDTVKQDPAAWQRGHDRSRRVLGLLRARLPTPLRNQFPTTLHKLLESTPTDEFGSSERAIPKEIEALLTELTAE
jgi:predicted ATPase